MNVIIFLVILFLIWLIFGRQIKSWFAGFMARKTEDYLRKAAGLPPRPGSKEDRRRRREEERKASAFTSRGSRSRNSSDRFGSSRRGANSDSHEPLIPKEYAEDVEFVETISYSESTTIGIQESDGRRTVYHESQVSDVEWEEIKIKKK